MAISSSKHWLVNPIWWHRLEYHQNIGDIYFSILSLNLSPDQAQHLIATCDFHVNSSMRMNLKLTY